MSNYEYLPVRRLQLTVTGSWDEYVETTNEEDFSDGDYTYSPCLSGDTSDLPLDGYSFTIHYNNSVSIFTSRSEVQYALSCVDDESGIATFAINTIPLFSAPPGCSYAHQECGPGASYNARFEEPVGPTPNVPNQTSPTFENWSSSASETCQAYASGPDSGIKCAERLTPTCFSFTEGQFGVQDVGIAGSQVCADSAGVIQFNDATFYGLEPNRCYVIYTFGLPRIVGYGSSVFPLIIDDEYATFSTNVYIPEAMDVRVIEDGRTAMALVHPESVPTTWYISSTYTRIVDSSETNDNGTDTIKVNTHSNVNITASFF